MSTKGALFCPTCLHCFKSIFEQLYSQDKYLNIDLQINHLRNIGLSMYLSHKKIMNSTQYSIKEDNATMKKVDINNNWVTGDTIKIEKNIQQKSTKEYTQHEHPLMTCYVLNDKNVSQNLKLKVDDRLRPKAMTLIKKIGEN